MDEEKIIDNPALQRDSPKVEQSSAGSSRMPSGTNSHHISSTAMSLLQYLFQGGGPRRKSELKIEIEGVPEGRTHVEVLCFDLVYFTKPAQFVILSAGVFFFYLLYGYYQELIFSLPGFTGYGWYLTLIQFGYYSIFGKVRGPTELWINTTDLISVR